ncbi:cytochrome P450 [Byssothecium circinans]|uniref:Cytochrome P450 n=1 Tax=Byssothecium circinans TaxID=147558 RepID=A0A6A5TMB3_9PLEO|nr:cytochrome P450 [Byssothecium circinans]
MAVVAVLLGLLALPVTLLAWSYLSLKRNKAVAEKVGFPILVKWISPMNPFWMVMGSSIVKTCRKLNLGTANFKRMYFFGWEGNERSKIHEELGGSFMMVTPGGNWLCVGDADVINDAIRRPKDFRRNVEQMAVLNVYGKNLSTTEDEEWQKHRKVTSITFTERNNELVWHEAIAQSKAMLDYWKGHQPVTTIASDTKVFTLNVLAAAIFNKNYPFESSKRESKTATRDDSYRYRDSLSTILTSIVQIFVFGEDGLKAWWTPKSWKDAAVAIDVFRSYILGLIGEEREHASRGVEHNQHLVAALVRACEVEKRAQPAQPGVRDMSLTETEIISNLFVYAFAGNDTTAIVLGHILVDLAAHPQTQEWIAEELHHYLPSKDISQWDYRTFPKLKRCLAVVYEALRLDHPLNQLVKTTKDHAQTLQVDGKTYTLPAGTNVHLSLAAVHTHPRYWGDEGLKWKPERFITSADSGIEGEILAPDTSAFFLPWAYGQRICPGKKFSQVELVAALAMLFRDHVVAPQPQPGESMETARSRLFKTGMDINHEGTMLFEIAEPQKAALVWSERGH